MSYELIETVEVGAGGAASIEFTSIPQDGTDLKMVLSSRATSGTNYSAGTFYLNNEGYSDWKIQQLNSSGSSPNSQESTNTFSAYHNGSGSTGNTFSNAEFYISNYTVSIPKMVQINTTTENNATTIWQMIAAGRWSNNAAVTSVKIDGSNLAQYSTASLYKITAA